MAQKICFLFLSFLIGFLTGEVFLLPTEALAVDYKRTVIIDPSISRRCELLTEKRQQKITNKQRLLSLVERNKHLQEKTPPNRVSLKKKLESNLGHLEHEIILNKNQIQFVEETIVRQGCPGIAL